MFTSLRLKLTLWFVLLASIVYLTLTLLGLAFFNMSLTSAIDEELKVLASAIGHAIEINQGQPTFRDWARIVQTNPARSMATIQIFDIEGNLLEHYGPPGIPKLMLKTHEIQEKDLCMRICVSPLTKNDVLIGYIQLQLPTTSRDEAMHQLLFTASTITPLILLGLGFSSFFVAGKATAPVQENMQMLRTFMADAGHELNTPLSIVQARAESLERKLEKQNIDAEDLKIIIASNERMSKTVNDLMLLSEAEGTLENTFKQPIRIDKIVQQSVLEFQEKYKNKNVELVCHDLSTSLVQGNSDALRQVFINLLENGLKYTDHGGKVEIKESIDNGTAKIVIKDTGIGIHPDNLPYIFNRFYRADKSRSRASGGIGLGLSIVKAILEAHKGKIQVESTPGKGSIFTVTLPIS